MPQRRPRLTLTQWFLLTTLALAAVMTATLYWVFESSSRSILARSNELRDAEARGIDAKVSSELGVGATAIEDVARAMRLGLLPTDDPVAVEARLFFELLEHPTLSDLTLTRATRTGYDARGLAVLAPGDRWQVTVYRQSARADGELTTRRTVREDGRFVSYVRRRPAGGPFLSGAFVREGESADPTSHPTFETTASKRIEGRPIWSDLSYSELDAKLPEIQRRVVLTVQQAIEDVPGHFAGVLRAGLLTQTIDAIPSLAKANADDPSRVFLCDPDGRLVARVDPSDRLEREGDDLRIVSERAPQAIKQALERLRKVSNDQPVHSEEMKVDGARYLVTFRTLTNSQHWVAGVVVPEEYYTRDLRALRDRFRIAFLFTIAIVLFAGTYALSQMRGALGRIVAATSRMRSFDFAPSPTDAPFRDVADVMDGVERAKTSMRALGKYVPVDLVRELYESNREPQLGGELVEISLMFSDIEGFTSLSERLTPDALAVALGRYLEAMTSGVRSTEGTVDKFIGDSVMAFWNAPRRLADHAHRAAHAVLACQRATRELYASEAWRGLSPLFTRFGLHTARVMVGHFGAPERLSYTALGDGVNLASRLEGLCKQYGVGVLASEAFVSAAGEDLAFRLVDKVAVKGKEQAVRVYELLGLRVDCAEQLARAEAYERALDVYFGGDFGQAIDLLRAHADDPPSRVLVERCKAMIARPPPQGWNGVYVAASK
jgi:adenylate cyclase